MTSMDSEACRYVVVRLVRIDRRCGKKAQSRRVDARLPQRLCVGAWWRWQHAHDARHVCVCAVAHVRLGATMAIEFVEKRNAICGGVVCVGDGWRALSWQGNVL